MKKDGEITASVKVIEGKRGHEKQKGRKSGFPQRQNTCLVALHR